MRSTSSTRSPSTSAAAPCGSVRPCAVPVVASPARCRLLAALLRLLDDHPLAADLAACTNVTLFASGKAGVPPVPAPKSDQIHANAAGDECFARVLHAFLRESGIAPR
jgi:hypothetical protein